MYDNQTHFYIQMFTRGTKDGIICWREWGSWNRALMRIHRKGRSALSGEHKEKKNDAFTPLSSHPWACLTLYFVSTKEVFLFSETFKSQQQWRAHSSAFHVVFFYDKLKNQMLPIILSAEANIFILLQVITNVKKALEIHFIFCSSQICGFFHIKGPLKH